MSSAETQRPRRAVFVDALRILAAVQMIQGHTLDALLAPAHREGPGFAAWTFTRGLTSTTFLFTAGLSFVLASRALRDPIAARRRRLTRALELVLYGYLMHAPLAALFGTPWNVALSELYAVDVLQCIGVSLMLLELLFARAKARHAGKAALALGVCLFAAAPLAAGFVPGGPTRVLTNYVSPAGGSLFPLVPWTGYVLVGFAVGGALLEDVARLPQRLGALGALATCLGLGLARLRPGPDPRVALGFLVLKLGLVMLVAAALAFGLRKVARLPRLLERLAGETLFLYVSHVLVLYAGHVGLKARFGGTLAPGEALLVALALLVSCALGALAYRRVAQRVAGARA